MQHNDHILYRKHNYKEMQNAPQNEKFGTMKYFANIQFLIKKVAM
jgi:hypothetical protein